MKSLNRILKEIAEKLSKKKKDGIYSDNYYLNIILDSITSSGGGGGDITVDDELSSTSTNPVQNKVITSALSDKESTTNKVTDISGSSSNTEYPTAKAVHDKLVNKEDISNKTNMWSPSPKTQFYPSEKLVKESLDELVLSVEKKGSADEGFNTTYVLKQGNREIETHINIPKNSIFKSGEVKTCTEKDNPIEGLDVGDKYLDFILDSENEEHIYISLKDLAGATPDGITIEYKEGATLGIKNSGVSTLHLQDESVTYDKLDHNLIVDDLGNTSPTKVLSANQGFVLDEKKINVADIIDALNSEDDKKVLSAKQGKHLNDKKIDKTSIIDDLNSEASTEVLSAKQGSVLKGMIEDKEDKSNKIITWSSTLSDDKYPSEKLVKNNLDKLLLTVEEKETADEGFDTTYVLKQGGEEVTTHINIPKSSVFKSGEVKTCTVKDQPIEGLEVGDKYLDFILDTETENHIYISLKELAGAKPDNVTLEYKEGTEIGIKNNAVTTAHLVNNSITYDKLDADLVVDNLNYDTDDSKILSAKQGHILNENKIEKTDIVNNLNDGGESKVLSAEQGKALKDLIGDAITYINK